MKQALLLFLLLAVVSPSGGLAAKCLDIACYDLSLFGYSLAMSVSEATEIRPFHRISGGSYLDGSMAVGHIDTIFFEDFELAIRVEFVADQVFKVVGRFNPVDYAELSKLLETAYGPARDRSRTLDRPDGAQVRQRIHGWQFPDAKLVLIDDVGNRGFGTIALLPIIDRTPGSPATVGE